MRGESRGDVEQGYHPPRGSMGDAYVALTSS
jgi:hypothetical protein